MGENDYLYDRNKVAVQWGNQLAELRGKDPGGYRHLVKIYKDKGHWMDNLEASALIWMSDFVRDPYPDKIIWKQDDVLHKRFYWLKNEDPAVGDLIEAEINLLKFVYLYPQSSVYKKVTDNGYTVLQEQKYYNSNRDKLIKLLGEAPKSGKTYKRYHQLLSAIHGLNDKRLTNLFKIECWNFLHLYPNRSQCSMVMMWLAQLEQENNNFHPSVMVYE